MKQRPEARPHLIAADHSKRGRRFVTLLDPETSQVTLLEAWEHAIFVLADGTRDLGAIAELLAPEVEGQVIDADVVRRCLKFFEQKRLIQPLGLRTERPLGTPTAAELGQAYAEWHKEAPGQGPELIPPPVPRSELRFAPGLTPTISAARPGIVPSSGLLKVESLLAIGAEPPEDGAEPLDVLAAVDLAVSEADHALAEERQKKAGGEIQEVESVPMTSQVISANAISVQVSPELEAEAKPSKKAEKKAKKDPIPSAEAPAGRPPARLSEVLALDATEPETTLSPAATEARRRARRAASEPTQRLREGPKTKAGKLVDEP
ncbi:MAG: hypothetical protein U1E65_06365 [Myxococcota bacterium]